MTTITMVFVKMSRVFCEIECEIYLLFRRGFITVSTEIFRSSKLYCTRLLPVFILHFQDVSFLQNLLSNLCTKLLFLWCTLPSVAPQPFLLCWTVQVNNILTILFSARPLTSYLLPLPTLSILNLARRCRNSELTSHAEPSVIDRGRWRRVSGKWRFTDGFLPDVSRLYCRLIFKILNFLRKFQPLKTYCHSTPQNNCTSVNV
jgi:hypothetical protein